MSTFLHNARDAVARSLSPSSDAPKVSTPTIPTFEPREAPASITGGSQQSSDFSWDSEALGLPPHPDDPTASHVSGGSTPRRRKFVAQSHSEVVRDVSFSSGGSFDRRLQQHVLEPAAQHTQHESHSQHFHHSGAHVQSDKSNIRSHMFEKVEQHHRGDVYDHQTPRAAAVSSNFTRASISATTRRLQQAQNIEGQLRRQLHSNEELFRSLAMEHSEIQAQLAALRASTASSRSSGSRTSSQRDTLSSTHGADRARTHAAPHDKRTVRSTPGNDDASSVTSASTSASSGSSASRRLRQQQQQALLGGVGGGSSAQDSTTASTGVGTAVVYNASVDTSAPTAASAAQSTSRSSADSHRGGRAEQEATIRGQEADTTAPTAASAPSDLQDEHSAPAEACGADTTAQTASTAPPAVAQKGDAVRDTTNNLHVQVGQGGHVTVHEGVRTRDGRQMEQNQGDHSRHSGQGGIDNIWGPSNSSRTAPQPAPLDTTNSPEAGGGSPGIHYLLRKTRSGHHHLTSPSLLHFALRQRSGGGHVQEAGGQGIDSSHLLPGSNTSNAAGMHPDTIRAVNDAVRSIADAVRTTFGSAGGFNNTEVPPAASDMPGMDADDSCSTAGDSSACPPSTAEGDSTSSGNDGSSVSTAGSLQPDPPSPNMAVQHSLQVAASAGEDEGGAHAQKTSPLAAQTPQYPVADSARQAFHLFPHPHYEWYNVRADALPSDGGRTATSDVVHAARNQASPLAPGQVSVTHPPLPADPAVRSATRDAKSDKQKSSQPPGGQWVSHATYRDALRSAEAMFLTLRSLGVKASQTETARGAGDGHEPAAVSAAVGTREAIRRDKAFHAKRIRGAQPSQRDKAARVWASALQGVPKGASATADTSRPPVHPLDAVLRHLPDPLVAAAPDVARPLPGMHRDKVAREALHLGDLFAPAQGGSHAGDDSVPQWVQRARGVSAREPSPAAALRCDALQGAVQATEDPRALAGALASVLQEVCSELGATRVSDALPRLRRCVSAAQQLPALRRFSNVVCDTVGATLVADEHTVGIPAVGLEEALHVLRDALPARRRAGRGALSEDEVGLLRAAVG